jgi:hypothetical protein
LIPLLTHLCFRRTISLTPRLFVNRIHHCAKLRRLSELSLNCIANRRTVAEQDDLDVSVGVHVLELGEGVEAERDRGDHYKGDGDPGDHLGGPVKTRCKEM